MLKASLDAWTRREQWPKAAAAIHEVSKGMKKKATMFIQALKKKIEEGNMFESKFIFPVSNVKYAINPSIKPKEKANSNFPTSNFEILNGNLTLNEKLGVQIEDTKNMKEYVIKDFDEITSCWLDECEDDPGYCDVSLTGKVIKHGKEGNALEPMMHWLAK